VVTRVCAEQCRAAEVVQRVSLHSSCDVGNCYRFRTSHAAYDVGVLQVACNLTTRKTPRTQGRNSDLNVVISSVHIVKIVLVILICVIDVLSLRSPNDYRKSLTIVCTTFSAFFCIFSRTCTTYSQVCTTANTFSLGCVWL
jgi:hypothetical protein